MSAVDEILSQIPLDQLASQLGTDEQTAGAAAQQAIPALLSGLQANAQDPAGAASLEGALGNHSASLIDGGVDLNQVDTNDGQKIVGNIFGDHSEGVAQTLGGSLGGLGGGGGQSDLMKRLLPLLAPIVLSYLAKRFTGGGQSGLGGQDGGAGGGLLGSILGGAMGGGGGNGRRRGRWRRDRRPAGRPARRRRPAAGHDWRLGQPDARHAGRHAGRRPPRLSRSRWPPSGSSWPRRRPPGWPRCAAPGCTRR